jgi:ATP-dependent exoDNAse (exonuclease V) alpha subunit
MDASPLMAALLKHTTAKHIIFVGDQRQLQPIGPGSPFRDMIASGAIPTVHLTQNYRTNCRGILALCDDIFKGTISTGKSINKRTRNKTINLTRCAMSRGSLVLKKPANVGSLIGFGPRA